MITSSISYNETLKVLCEKEEKNDDSLEINKFFVEMKKKKILDSAELLGGKLENINQEIQANEFKLKIKANEKNKSYFLPLEKSEYITEEETKKKLNL